MILLRLLLYIVSNFAIIANAKPPRMKSSTFSSSASSSSSSTTPTDDRTSEWFVPQNQCHDPEYTPTPAPNPFARWQDCMTAVQKINAADQPPWSVIGDVANGKRVYKILRTWEHRTCLVVGEVSLDWPVLKILAALMDAGLMVMEKCFVDQDESAPAGGGRQGLGGTIFLRSDEHGEANIMVILSGLVVEGDNPWPRKPWPDLGKPS